MLLTPYRVLDLTGPLGFLTGKIFGDLGADVIKIEPPAGDPSRRQPPCLNNGNGGRQSLYWLAYNANKRGITLNLEADKGRELFYRLPGGSEFIIGKFSSGARGGLGVSFCEFIWREPSLVFVFVSPVCGGRAY